MSDKEDYIKRLDEITNQLEKISISLDWLVRREFDKVNTPKYQPVPNYPTPYPNVEVSTTCSKCGMVWKGDMLYSCTQFDCPIQTKSTSSQTYNTGSL